MRTVSLLSILLVSLLAGCTSNPSPPPSTGGDVSEAEEAANEIPLEATDETGVIRGIVVDTGVRPLPNVLVTVTSGDVRQTSNTTANGAFGFDGLKPGTYFVKASKPGFRDGQTSADVVAGVSNPPLARLALEPNPSTRPFVVPVKSVGYIECGATAVLYSVAVCSVPNDLPGCDTTGTCTLTEDVFLFVVGSEQVPQWSQTELVWSSTQALGDAFRMSYSYECETNNGLLCNSADARGGSPLLLTANHTAMLETLANGTKSEFMIRVFNSDVPETRPPAAVLDPLDAACVPGQEVPGVGTVGGTCGACVNTVALGAPCLRGGVGLTLQQRFEVYTHLFYGYTPPEWRFSSGTEAPQPPA